MKKSNYVLVQCADGGETDALRKENQDLRRELDRVRGVALYPFSRQDEPCRKCGYATLETVATRADDGEWKKTSYACGPPRVFVAAVPKRLWHAAVSERMKLTCLLCKAVYFERTRM